ncbi:unnamed protein product, partial [Ixodes persulcatus]
RGKKACARVPPGPLKGSPSPCSPRTNWMSMFTGPVFLCVNVSGDTGGAATLKALAISLSTALRSLKRRGYLLMRYESSVLAHLEPCSV